MTNLIVRTRGRPYPTRHRFLRPVVEGLEKRLLLYATSGGRWAFGSRITYSFAPDGTNIGGISSSLSQAMTNDGIATATWQQQFQKAAAIWEAVANVNLTQVSDNGAAYGTSGNQQSDSHFGDIRIGGTPLANGVLATTFLPPPYNSGTLAGDIVFNTNTAWHVNSDYDVLTVAIHEFGHALGMDHSAISTADMYATYNAIKQTLTSDDTSGIQSIYSTRTADANNSSTNAATVSLNAQGQAILSGYNLASSTAIDWFKVVIPSVTNGTLVVTMQSSGLSLLSPKVILYNGSLQGLMSASSTSYGATVTATVSNVSTGQTYYIKCLAAIVGPSGSGAFGLTVNTGSGTIGSVPPPNTVVAQQADQGGGSTNLGSWSNHDHGHDCDNNDDSFGGDVPERVAVGKLQGWGDYLTASQSSGVHEIVASPASHQGTMATALATADPGSARRPVLGPVAVPSPVAVDGLLAVWDTDVGQGRGRRRGPNS
jgi:hypothetical protein